MSPIRLALLILIFTAFCHAYGQTAIAEPSADSQPSGIFEIRTYTTAPGKLDELHKRFREHTMKLFERHGMVNVAYWTPQDSTLAQTTLIYVLAHKSRQAAEESWEAFRGDPDWQKVRTASEENGAIVTRVESVFVEATDYSPMK
jgi:hypothetical protein